MKCTRCGAENSESQTTCSSCGAPLYASCGGSCNRPGGNGPAIPTYYRGFASAIRTCLLEKYLTFSGRATRSEYWFYYLFNVLVGLFFWVFIALFMMILGPKVGGVLSGILGLVYGVAALVTSLAAGVRRLHDTGKSGWLMLLGFIPVVGALILLVFFVLDSNPYDNAYGLAPHEER